MNGLDPKRIWQEFRYYESSESLAMLAKDRLGYELPAAQAEEILACFQLARDYFDAAAPASITIKPVPLFYGMTNLAKALILLCGGRERRRLANLSAGHGLTFSRPVDDGLERFGCVVASQGTFADFIDTFSCQIPFNFPGLFDAALRKATATELSGKAFTFQELMGWFPELRSLHEKTFGLRQPIVRVAFDYDPMRRICRLLFPMGARLPDEYRRSFRLGTSFLSSIEHHRTPPASGLIQQIATKPPLPPGWGYWIEVYESGLGWPMSVEVDLELSPDQTSHLSAWGAQFAGMYILSMVVRYEPSLWVNLTGRTGRRQILALVEAFVSLAEHSFPKRALELLEHLTILKDFVTSLDGVIPGSLG